jgi:hypothetical protein
MEKKESAEKVVRDIRRRTRRRSSTDSISEQQSAFAPPHA